MPSSLRPILVSLAATFLLGGLAGDASAQRSRGSAPTDGDWSLMFTLFEEQTLTHFGIFRMTGDRLNLGLEAELDWAAGEQEVSQQQSGILIRSEGDSWSFLVGPSARWYGSRIGPVSPYLRSRLSVGWGGSELTVNDNRQSYSDSFTLQASLGIGAEWYPLRWLGVGGHTGLAYARISTESVNENNGSASDSRSHNVRTFRSGVVVNFYFR